MTPAAEIVEAITIAHLEQVRLLFREYQSGLPADCRFTDTEWQNVPGRYAPPGGTLLLATVRGEAAGCVGLRSFPLPGTCEMKRLYVKPECRGLGLGRELVTAIVGRARHLGYQKVRLDTLPESMVAAVSLYRQLGFVALPQRDLVGTSGLLDMELHL